MPRGLLELGMHTRSKPALHITIEDPSRPDQMNVAGFHVGDVCFDCESRVELLEGGNGVLLAWCECVWPDEHYLMEIIRTDN
jgi:hypothetical protein